MNKADSSRLVETSPFSDTCVAGGADGTATFAPAHSRAVEAALLTGGIDKPYVFGLAMELASKGVSLDVIGSDELDSPEMQSTPGLRFLNLRGKQGEEASFGEKVSRILIYYARLIQYAAVAKPKVFHILWNNRFMYFDRTVLMLYYKLLGKKITFTAHNVNAGRRDAKDSWLNRLTLKVQYRLSDHIFVHTAQMRDELLQEFGVSPQAVTVIPFGINNAVPNTRLTPAQARQRLGIKESGRTILFFGRIAPYKGLEFLVSAFRQLAAKNSNYRLLIVGKPHRGSESHLETIQETIRQETAAGQVIQKIEFVPDNDTELYFKAADVLALPYTQVYQSGVLFLAYSFGLPVIAADVGSFREDVMVGRTGFMCQPGDAVGLASALETYFDSDLFKTLDSRRPEIQDYANARHSWDTVGDETIAVYARLLAQDVEQVTF